MKNLDSIQKEINSKLKNLAISLEEKSEENFFTQLFSKKNLKSFYIYGGVGRGKTMLMKNFFHSLKKTPKIYFHFNSFMQTLHENLRDIRMENKKYDDELIEAVKRIVKDKSLICFDEFQVVDIADAMLLSRIFSYFFHKKIVIIFTSNSHPKDLYKNGLQREVFLEFVNKILLKNCEILHLDSQTDYRALSKNIIDKRYFIFNEKNEKIVKNIIKNFKKDKKFEEKELKVWGRLFIIKKTFDQIAVINFSKICKNNFSSSDYRAICKNFDLIFLLNVPKLEKDEFNEARRFMLFIDEVYENKVALIILAQTSIEKIYSDLKFEAFARTISRLNEIKSDFYWNNSKIAAKIKLNMASRARV